MHLDSLRIFKATHILTKNPQEPVKIYPRLQVLSPTLNCNWKMTPNTCFQSIGSSNTTSQCSRLDALDAIEEETPPGGSLISQQHYMTSHQICKSAVPQLSTAAISVSPIATSKSSASASAITHLNHPRSPLTRVYVITNFFEYVKWVQPNRQIQIYNRWSTKQEVWCRCSCFHLLVIFLWSLVLSSVRRCQCHWAFT